MHGISTLADAFDISAKIGFSLDKKICCVSEIYIIKGEHLFVVVVVVFRGRALELASVLPRWRAPELISRGGVRAEAGFAQIRPNNAVGDEKKSP